MFFLWFRLLPVRPSSAVPRSVSISGCSWPTELSPSALHSMPGGENLWVRPAWKRMSQLRISKELRQKKLRLQCSVNGAFFLDSLEPKRHLHYCPNFNLSGGDTGSGVPKALGHFLYRFI